MRELSSWVPRLLPSTVQCAGGGGGGVWGVSMQLRVRKSKAVLEVSVLPPGTPNPQSHLPASGLHLLTGKLPGAQLAATCFCQELSAFVLPPNRTFF